KTLGAGDPGWGILVTSFGIGMGIGLASSNKVVEFVPREYVFVWSIIAAAGTLLVLAAMPAIGQAAVIAVILGGFCGSAWVNGYVLLQENVTDEFRGRTFGALTVLSRLGLFLSLTIFPVIAGAIGVHTLTLGERTYDLSGTRISLMIAGVGALLAGLLTRSRLRRFRVGKQQPLGLVPKLKRPPTSGLFVAFEGVEGSGKGTQIRLAKEWLESQGVEVMVTREPGGTPVGEELRKMLLAHDTGHIEPKTEALLFAASRAQHVASVIRPALAAGQVVLTDRYIDSSLAYQGSARGLGEQDVLTLNVWATQGLFPDLVLLLHLEPEAGLLRSLEEPDRIELEGQDFHAKVSDAYLRIAEEHPERGSRCSTASRVRSTRSRSCARRRRGRTTRTCWPAPRAEASSSPRGRSRRRCCARRVGAGPAGTADWRSRIVTRTRSSSNPRVATSTWRPFAPRSGTPRTAPPPSPAA